MNDNIKSFVPFKQEFNPVKLYEIIESFNRDQLIELNVFVTGDEIKDNPEHYIRRQDFLNNPICFLKELCQDEYQSGQKFFLEYDNIWEHRFKYQEIIERIKNER